VSTVVVAVGQVLTWYSVVGGSKLARAVFTELRQDQTARRRLDRSGNAIVDEHGLSFELISMYSELRGKQTLHGRQND